MLQTEPVSIKLPVLSGHEYTGEFRRPKADEYFLDNRDGNANIYRQNFDATQFMNAYHILRKLWAPKREDLCLKSGWIAMDANGIWFWYSTKPVVNMVSMTWDCDENSVALSPLVFDLPNDINWLNSLRKI